MLKVRLYFMAVSALIGIVGALAAISMEIPSPFSRMSANLSLMYRVAPSTGAVNVRMAPFGAKGDGKTDDTAAIQRAINHSAKVYMPAGIYRIDPRAGLVIRTGTQLVGDGRAATLLLADAAGGSVTSLAGYGAGSIIRRHFNPAAPNAYVSYVRLADFGVILTHPRDRITLDQVQIGIDFRNVSRSLIERVHVGNTLPEGAPLRRTGAHVHDSQGYGIVLGTVQSSLPSYAGGELNVVRDSSVWGAYKAIVQDDASLSPRSAAHATIVENADLQGAQALLSQESRYTRATVWRDNILQNVVPRPDGADQATVIRMDGQDGKVDGGYVEAGGLARYLVYLNRDTKNIFVNLIYTSCTNKPENIDLGDSNAITITRDCPAILRRSL